MNIIKITLTIFLFSCCNLFSKAEGDEKRTFSLEEAQNFAIENNLNIKNAALKQKLLQQILILDLNYGKGMDLKKMKSMAAHSGSQKLIQQKR